jgi:hypothetical protein
MEPINDILDPDEKIIWGVVVEKDTPQERHFVVTDRRIYRKAQDVIHSNYSEAPKEFLRVINNILIIERLGIKIVTAPNYSSLYVNLRGMQINIPILMFDSLTSDDIKAIFNILSESSNISKTYMANFYRTNYELMKDFIINLDEVMFPTSSSQPVYPSPSLPEPKTESEPPPLITPEKYQQKLQTPELYQEEENSYKQSQDSTPTLRFDQSVFSHSHLSTDFRQDFPSTSPNIGYKTPKQVKSEPSKSYEEYKMTSQVLEANDENLYYGSQCAYCKENISNYQEKLYTCKECGVFFHEYCLEKLMQEGFCPNCNRTLIY